MAVGRRFDGRLANLSMPVGNGMQVLSGGFASIGLHPPCPLPHLIDSPPWVVAAV
jgi:hypothetical protein